MLESPVGISVPLAICLGLLASFIQSLGLTIQRKAHIQNESIPITKRKSVWRMPLFLIGFIIFISANIGGTIFQIGALPLTILAPLGAVSLLFNALLARVLLNGLLSFYMVSGECTSEERRGERRDMIGDRVRDRKLAQDGVGPLMIQCSDHFGIFSHLQELFSSLLELFSSDTLEQSKRRSIL